MALLIPPHIHDILTYVCASFKDEWTMCGKVERTEDGLYRLVDLKIPKQSNSGASTEVEQGDWADMLSEEFDDLDKWIVWIHSHNTMGCFWSNTDYAQMGRFGDEGMPFLISLVVSTKGAQNGRCDTLARLSVFNPVQMGINIPTVTLFENREEVDLEKWKKEVEDKTVEKKYTPSSRWKDYDPRAWRRGKKNKAHSNYYEEEEEELSAWGYEECSAKALIDMERPEPNCTYFIDEIDKNAILDLLEFNGYNLEDKNLAILDALQTYRSSAAHGYEISVPFIRTVAKEYEKTYMEVFNSLSQIT